MMKRRQFLGTALGWATGALTGCGGGNGGDGMMSGPSAAVDALLEGQALRSLAVLPNESGQSGQFRGTLAAAPTPAALVPGQSTAMWLYNGIAPGPLLELREGQHVRIRLDNGLAQDTTVHWHGLLVPSDQDGNPMDPVRPGASRTYEFDVPTGTAGTYWYHPHAHQTVAEQVAHGLAAPLIVRAADDPLAHIPEVTLFVSGLRLDREAQISPHDARDWMLGRQGEALLVNGGRLPVHTVRPGTTQRWRILNATSARFFRIALDGHTLTLVGTDGGLLAAPIAGLSEILLAPAQRIEVLVTVRATPNARYSLRALRYESEFMGLGAYSDEDLLTLATSAEPPAAPAVIPPSLRPIGELGVPGARQRIELSERMGMGMMGGGMSGFLINGRSFDMGRVDLVATQGQVELWDIVNRTAMDHPIHIHGTQFQLVSRQAGGVMTPAPYLAWLDTVNVPARQSATIKVRQTMSGKRMFHCHILEHEDAGMMAVLDVRPA
ncbi:MAG: multicopper oxidase family protein [Betaproteobacteria bacterium]|nr:multicopper oxidase family protein [Betaproteobacteria bacterium]